MSNESSSDRGSIRGESELSSGRRVDPNAADLLRQQIAGKQAESDDLESEEEVWQGGYSPKAMVGTWLLIASISLAMLVGVIASGSALLPVALGALLLIWGAGGLVYAWRRLGFHYQLTTQRFLHQTGVLTRRTDRIEVIDIDDVSFSQGLIERFFSVGTIVLTSSDRSHPVLSMIGIADVKKVAGLIDDIRRKERRRRSLHIEAI